MKYSKPLSSLSAALLALLWAGPAPTQDVNEDHLPGGLLEGELDGRRIVCPMLKTMMETHIKGDIATVKLIQTFSNPHPKALHARYVFPLPENAAVYAMRMHIGPRVIEAQIHEKQEAVQIYEQAKKKGQQAALLTQHRPNVFTQRVANLMPGDKILVELHYAHSVPKRDGRFRFHFPMVVGPRYISPGKAEEGEPEATELGQWTLPASAPVAGPQTVDPERVSILVHLQAGQKISWLDSNSHVIDVHDRSEGGKEVRLAAGRTIDNQDFVLDYQLSGPKVSAGVTTWAKDGQGVLSLLIEPPHSAAPAQITPREMVFVLDCSGSMRGVPLDTSKRFMRQALRNLRPSDYFRIIRFSHSASEFARTPLKATKANLARGLAFIDSLNGSGGTEMISGVRAALSPPTPKDTMRIVVFLTDGYIGNEARISRFIQSARRQARLFSFGVGNAVNRYLLAEMARAGQGVARFVRPDEDAAKAADKLAQRLQAPFLTDVSLHWSGAPVTDATPARLPDLFMGQSLRVLARFEAAGTALVTIEGKVAGRVVKLPLEIDLPQDDAAGRALDVLWARSQVEDRMIDYLDPSQNDVHRQAVKAEVIDLGLAHSLVTQWTAFVAVDRKQVNKNPDGSEKDVPVPQVAGVSKAAYPQNSFMGSAAPEPHQWAALALLLLMAGFFLRRP